MTSSPTHTVDSQPGKTSASETVSRNFLDRFPIHPLLLSIYVPLFLFAHNFYQVYPDELLLPLLLFLLAGTIVFLIMRFALGNWQSSATLSSATLFFLLFYGFIVTEENKKFFSDFYVSGWIILASIALFAIHMLFILKRKPFSAAYGGLRKIAHTQNRTLLFTFGCLTIVAAVLALLVSESRIHTFHIVPVGLWLALAFCSCVLLYKSVKNYETINRALNVFTIIIVMISLGQIAYSAFTARESIVATDDSIYTSNIDPSELPDIYYIIPDEYAGRDTLLKMYNFTNEEFWGWLKEKNFYVPEHSLSNYNKTHLSVPSSLNMNFIDKLIDTNDVQDADKLAKLLEQLAKDNLVVKTLKKNHYIYINVGSRWSLTGKNPNADISYSYEGLNHFNELVVESTLLRALNSPAQVFDFEVLKNIPDIDKSPKFVFAHMPVPHVPFIYDKDGNILPADEWYNFDNYLGQLLFVNRELKEITSSILEKTKRPLVVIIQSDHGFRFCDKVSSMTSSLCETINERNNLNAYYFSDGDYSGLYEGITPVNSFRVVFNKYLKTNYSLLPNEPGSLKINLDHD